MKRTGRPSVDPEVKIDRERFFVLTAAIAMGVSLAPAGCATESPPQAPAPPPPPPPAPTIIYVMVPAAVPVPTTSAQPQAQPQPQPQVAPAPPAPPQLVATTRADPYKATPIHGQACAPSLNMQGSAPACSLKAPGPTCESFSDTKQECPTISKLLKPRVAQAAGDCLQKASGTKDICEFNVSSICMYDALQTACIEPYAKKACDGVMARCGGGPKGNYNKMTRDACEAGVSGIADGKRAKFISCITESCRFEVCLAYL